MEFRIYKDKTGDWRWSLVVKNGRAIADSAEGYRNKKDCMAGIALVMSSHTAGVVSKKVSKRRDG